MMARVRKGDLLVREDESPSLVPDFIFCKRSADHPPSGYRLFKPHDGQKALKKNLSLTAADFFCEAFIRDNPDELRSPERWARLCTPNMVRTFRGFAVVAERVSQCLDQARGMLVAARATNPSKLEDFLELTTFYSCLRGMGPSRSLRLEELEGLINMLQIATNKASDLGTLCLIDSRTFEKAINYCRRLPLVIACRRPDGRLDLAAIERHLGFGADEGLSESSDRALCIGLDRKSFGRTWDHYKERQWSGSSASITHIMVHELPPPYEEPIVREGLLYLRPDNKTNLPSVRK